MAYYKIPFTGAFDYPAGCLLETAYAKDGFMWCAFDAVQDTGLDWIPVTEEVFNANRPDIRPPADIIHEAIATSATLSGGSIALDLPANVQTGTMVKFDAPCKCNQVTGGLVIDGKTYTVCDALGQCITGSGGAWDSGAMISVLIDKEERKAFVVNAAAPRYKVIQSRPRGAGKPDYGIS